MATRAEIESAIVDDELFVERLARLVEGRSDLETWTDGMTSVLALALQDETLSRSESWKAVALRRHLFGPMDVVPERLVPARRPTEVDRRRAERLRSDLPGRLQYRAGMHLVRSGR